LTHTHIERIGQATNFIPNQWCNSLDRFLECRRIDNKMAFHPWSPLFFPVGEDGRIFEHFALKISKFIMSSSILNDVAINLRHHIQSSFFEANLSVCHPLAKAN